MGPSSQVMAVVSQLEIGSGGEQNFGLGMENRNELMGRVWLERWASEHDSGGQTLAETTLHTGWRKPKVICPL